MRQRLKLCNCLRSADVGAAICRPPYGCGGSRNAGVPYGCDGINAKYIMRVVAFSALTTKSIVDEYLSLCDNNKKNRRGDTYDLSR